MRLSFAATLLALVGMLTGCLPASDPSRPIPTLLVPAKQPATRLVVVLPGRADDLKALRRSGIAEAIQAAWPDADVLLAEVTMGYYREGRAPERLHDEVIAPARARGGYREVWLGGASMGGMGTLMYDQRYPGDMDGLVLLAPYLGEAPLLREIEDAGGLARWDAGPPQAMGPDNWQRELWRHIQRWSQHPEEARRVWLAYGDRDRLRASMPILAGTLPPDHALVRKGGHTWTVWSPAMGEVLQTVAQKRMVP